MLGFYGSCIALNMDLSCSISWATLHSGRQTYHRFFFPHLPGEGL